MGETVRIRLLREPEPPSSDGSEVRFGLQDKRGAMHEGVACRDGLMQFDFDVAVTAAPDGAPDFGGPFVSGPRGQRFVYLSWQRARGTGFMNRIKVRLADLDWALVRRAWDENRPVQANLRGAPTGGGTRPVNWTIVE